MQWAEGPYLMYEVKKLRVKDPQLLNNDVKTMSSALCMCLKMVGATGFEPATPWSQTKCATKLRYAPIKHAAC